MLCQTPTQSLLGGGREKTQRILGRRLRGAQRVVGRTNSGKKASSLLLSVFLTILCVPLKATGYESGVVRV